MSTVNQSNTPFDPEIVEIVGKFGFVILDLDNPNMWINGRVLNAQQCNLERFNESIIHDVGGHFPICPEDRRKMDNFGLGQVGGPFENDETRVVDAKTAEEEEQQAWLIGMVMMNILNNKRGAYAFDAIGEYNYAPFLIGADIQEVMKELFKDNEWVYGFDKLSDKMLDFLHSYDIHNFD